MARALLLALSFTSLMAACGEDVATVDASECASTKKWVGDNSGAPIMHPGGDCIGCHRSKDDGPSFKIAGTVYGAPNQATDCFGVQGATVEITDASGKVLNLLANEAGNFYTTESVAMPYKARVLFNGKERVMNTPQSSGACNTCHSQGGSSGAPGRILIP